jgi:16S rRNA processing protein RimM
VTGGRQKRPSNRVDPGQSPTARRAVPSVPPAPLPPSAQEGEPLGERLVVGVVRGVHGLHGALRVEPLTDDADRFAVGTSLTREGETSPLTITWAQADGPGYLVQFHEVTTREGADALRNAYLEGAAPSPLAEGQYYWHEVVGALVRTTDGEDLGTVADVFRAGGAEVYAVRGGPRGEVLVPAVHSVVRSFRPREAFIEVDGGALGLELPRSRRPRGRVSSRAADRATRRGPGGVEQSEPAAGVGDGAHSPEPVPATADAPHLSEPIPPGD